MMGREKAGAMLIELLVALVVAGLLMVTLTASICELMRLSTTSQNDSVGAQIAANIMERVRATPFDSLDGLDKKIVAVNSGVGVPLVATVPRLKRPAMIDAENQDWFAAGGGRMPVSSVPATARISVTGSGDVRYVTVDVSWNSYDELAPSQRRFKLLSFAYRYGVQRNG
jgi:Tfp pilus assembly protein PilV